MPVRTTSCVTCASCLASLTPVSTPTLGRVGSLRACVLVEPAHSYARRSIVPGPALRLTRADWHDLGRAGSRNRLTGFGPRHHGTRSGWRGFGPRSRSSQASLRTPAARPAGLFRLHLAGRDSVAHHGRCDRDSGLGHGTDRRFVRRSGHRPVGDGPLRPAKPVAFYHSARSHTDLPALLFAYRPPDPP